MHKLLAFRNHPLYRFALWAALAISLIVLWRVNASVLSNPKYIPVDDFSHYWAAGRLNISGINPYNPIEVQKIRDALTGTTTEYGVIPIMWTPPWSLPFVMPFGFLDYPISRLLWLMAHITIILACANFCWRIYGGKLNRIALGWIAAFILGPTISVLEKGQITPWVLFGVVGFLIFIEDRKQPFWAGVMIVLIAIKPQLFYLFFPALLIWLLSQHAWKVLLGIVTGFTTALFISILFNPGLVWQYITAITSYPPTDWATPTIGGYLRLLFGIDRFWLQFIPTVVGLVWLLIVWIKNRNNWIWSQRLPSLLFMSILSTPYAWTYDQVILLPAVIIAVISINNSVQKKLSSIFWTVYIGINFLDLWLHRYYDDFWFIWLAPGLALWFYGVIHASQSQDEKLTFPSTFNP